MKPTMRRAFVAEPPPQYLKRPPAVVDCSMLCAVLFDEAERDAAEDLMAGHRLLAPTLLVHEFVNVALKKLRRGLPAEVVERALADFRPTTSSCCPPRRSRSSNWPGTTGCRRTTRPTSGWRPNSGRR